VISHGLSARVVVHWPGAETNKPIHFLFVEDVVRGACGVRFSCKVFRAGGWTWQCAFWAVPPFRDGLRVAGSVVHGPFACR